MQHELRSPTMRSLGDSRFNCLKESRFFLSHCYKQGKTRADSSKHEYSDKGLFTNELNQAYFF